VPTTASPDPHRLQPDELATLGVLSATDHGVTVLRPQGALDASVLGELDDLLRRLAPDVPALIDLSDCVLADPPRLADLDPRRWGRTAECSCVACRRGTGRLLLARSGVGRRMAMFSTSEDAVQARILADEGYGPGWWVPATPDGDA
jgi:hypothetical protein